MERLIKKGVVCFTVVAFLLAPLDVYHLMGLSNVGFAFQGNLGGNNSLRPIAAKEKGAIAATPPVTAHTQKSVVEVDGEQPVPEIAASQKDVSKNVLVVEDEPSVAAVIEAALKMQEFNVTIVDTAAEGIAKIDSGDFGMVITDLGLRDGERGKEVIEAAKQKGLPVVLVSGKIPHDVNDAQRPGLRRQYGADEVFGKPISPLSKFIAVVKKLSAKPAPVTSAIESQGRAAAELVSSV